MQCHPSQHHFIPIVFGSRNPSSYPPLGGKIHRAPPHSYGYWFSMVFPAPPAVWVATHVDAVVQTSDVGRCSWPKKPGDTGSLVLHSSKMFYKEWLSWNPHNGSTNPRYCVNNHLQVSKYNYIINSSVVHYIHCNGKCGPSERLSWSNQEAVTEIC